MTNEQKAAAVELREQLIEKAKEWVKRRMEHEYTVHGVTINRASPEEMADFAIAHTTAPTAQLAAMRLALEKELENHKAKEEAKAMAVGKMVDYLCTNAVVEKICELFDAGHAHATAEMAERVERLEKALARITIAVLVNGDSIMLTANGIYDVMTQEQYSDPDNDDVRTIDGSFSSLIEAIEATEGKDG